jgi:hypothetical protein
LESHRDGDQQQQKHALQATHGGAHRITAPIPLFVTNCFQKRSIRPVTPDARNVTLRGAHLACSSAAKAGLKKETSGTSEEHQSSGAVLMPPIIRAATPPRPPAAARATATAPRKLSRNPRYGIRLPSANSGHPVPDRA